MWSPDSEGPSVHVFHSQLIILGLLSQRSNPLLNVSVRHAFNISEDRDHQALKKEKYNVGSLPRICTVVMRLEEDKKWVLFLIYLFFHLWSSHSD